VHSDCAHQEGQDVVHDEPAAGVLATADPAIAGDANVAIADPAAGVLATADSAAGPAAESPIPSADRKSLALARPSVPR